MNELDIETEILRMERQARATFPPQAPGGSGSRQEGTDGPLPAEGGTSTRSVYFVDSGDELVVARACKSCAVTQEDIRALEIVVSPRGTAHHTDEYGETTCGRDATKTGWWWPL